ncbi:MAG: hypothetical protein VXV96_10110 [Bdellovibrionota bacterium]|nr:hypothetical protein [Bdellovibrionota bacterium]
MSSDVKAAWIGAGSAIFVSLISSISGYYLTTSQETAQPPPVIIKEPFIVKEREVIREYVSSNLKDSELSGIEPVINEKEDIDKAESVDQPSYQNTPSELETVLAGKKIGIYYSLKDSAAKSKASQLAAQMRAKKFDATFYSIGRFYRYPKTPSQTYIWGVGDSSNLDEFKSQFHETFDFIGVLNVSRAELKSQPVIEGDKWLMAVGSDEKDIYIIIGI